MGLLRIPSECGLVEPRRYAFSSIAPALRNVFLWDGSILLAFHKALFLWLLCILFLHLGMGICFYFILILFSPLGQLLRWMAIQIECTNEKNYGNGIIFQVLEKEDNINNMNIASDLIDLMSYSIVSIC